MILIVLGWSCKENPKQTEQKIETVKQETKTKTSLPESIKEIATFATPDFTDTTDIQNLIIFKELDLTSNTISNIDLDRASDLYKKLATRGQAASLPIFAKI